MTRINRLVMKGFKSFASHTELVFDKDFNVILGPNGSGKSNVLDAICFVIGKSSAKSLRAEKTGNLVYNGGKTNKPAKDAEVSIFFDNSNKIFPLEDKEVKITRIVSGDGTSVYKINNKKKTRGDILELLQYAKIDPNGYNIILQGDIIKLVEANPIDRRIIIEEIAGISIYEDKKQKAINELEKVDIKLNEAEIILVERGKSLQELKKEHDQAIRYKEVIDKKKSHEAALLLKNITKLKEDDEKFTKDMTEKRSTIEKNQADIEKFRSEIEAKKKDIEQITHEIETKGEKEQVDLHKVVETLKVGIATDRNRISALTQEIEKAKQRQVQLNASLVEIDVKIEELEKKKKDNKELQDKKTKDLSQMEERIAEYRKKFNLEGSKNIDQEIEQLDKKSDELDKRINSLRVQQQESLREKDRIEFKIQSLNENIAKVKEVEGENKKEMMNLKARKEEFKNLTLEVSKIISKDSQIAARLGAARERSIKLNEDYGRLAAKRASVTEALGSDEAGQKILSNKTKFPGVVGMVAELGDVDEKYALALEIAAGNKVKNIVVDSDQTASACINYLKQNRFGTATFIPINKIKPSGDVDDVKDVLKAKGVIGLAVDLIKFDSKYKKVFSYIFGSTLVVEDIEVARRIGIGKTKMVTIDGDLCESSGIMRGGFINRKSKSLSFSQSQINKEVEQAEAKLAETMAEISDLETEKKANEETLAKMRARKAELEGEIIKVEKSLHLDTGDLEANIEVKKEEEQKLKSADETFNKVISEISQLNSELARVKIRRQELRDEISKIRNPKVIAELNTFEEKKTQLKDDLLKLDNEIKGIDLQLNNILMPEKEKTSKILKQSDGEIKSFSSQITEAESKIKKDAKDLESKEKEEKQFYEKFKEMFNRKNKVNEEIQKLEVKIVSSEEYIRRIEEKIIAMTVDKTRTSTELKAYEEEFKEYQDVKPVENKSIEAIKQAIYNYKRTLEDMGFVNLKSLEIYEKVKEEFDSLNAKKEVLVKDKEEILLMMAEIEAKKKEMFLASFNQLNENFKEIFQSLSKKGEAFLELLDPENPFNDGMVIKVRLSGDKFMDIRSLSGGEKTMTALAFIFAIQEYAPASFYVLDEVDAALDKRNSDLLGSLIKKYSSKAQYVVISHNDEIISKGDNLYGVSMNEYGISKVVSLKV